MNNSTRDTLLSTIQQALAGGQLKPDETPTGYDRSPRPGETGTEAVLQRFVEMLGKVGGEGYILDREEAALGVLKELLIDMRGQSVLLPPDPELEKLGLRGFLAEAGVTVLRPGDVSLKQTATAAIGVTTAQAGIADTGTVVLMHTRERGRLAALLAPVHVVFLRKNAVHTDKVTFLAEARRAGMDMATTPLTWVTGPSLTADIEKVLVRGAHGPGRVVVLMY